LLAEEIKLILKKYPGESQVYLIVEGKKIKTSFKVQADKDVIVELESLVGKDNIKKS
jgi:hypothetical protein